MEDLTRRIQLLCPICGNDQFSAPDIEDENYDLSSAPDETRLQCSLCQNIFTKATLFEDNQSRINAAIEDMAQEVIKELAKSLK